jgi:YVTN family beta-propeller protein
LDSSGISLFPLQDGTTHTVEKHIAVVYTIGIAVDTHTNTIYVANSGDNTVSVIDGTTHTVEKHIPVGNSPSAVHTHMLIRLQVQFMLPITMIILYL